MRTSLVLMRAMLIPRSARAPNIRVATPVCVRMPTPRTDSLATAGSTETSTGPAFRAASAAAIGVGAGDGEGEVGVARRADVLDDHVHQDGRVADLAEDAGGVAGAVGDVEQGDARLLLVEFHARDDQVLHPRRGGPVPAVLGGRDRRRRGGGTPRGVVAGQVERLAVQLERLVDRPQRLGPGGAIDEDADLDLAGRDHLDVDAGGGQGLEHRRGDAGVCPHAEADDRHLGDARLVGHAGRADLLRGGLDDLQGLLEVVLGDGEADLGGAGGGDVLHDHVHDEVRPGDRAEEAVDDAGPVGHAQDGDARLVLRQAPPR